MPTFFMGPSMGSVGDAYDNAMCESFFATLECELLARRRFASQAQARNGRLQLHRGLVQRHSAVGYLSPIALKRGKFIREANGDRDRLTRNRPQRGRGERDELLGAP